MLKPARTFVLLVAMTAVTQGVCVPGARANRPPLPESTLQSSPAPRRGIEAIGPSVTRAGIQRQFGAESGLLRRYFRLVVDPGRITGEPRATATVFIREHAAELGLHLGRIDQELQLFSEKTSPSGTHLRWQQVVNGVPVERAEIVIKVSRSGQVSSVHNNLRPGLELTTAPGFGRAQAIERGVQIVRPAGRALGDFTAELGIVELVSGPRLVYLVGIPVERPMGDWWITLDARTGEVLGLEDRIVHVTGSGRTFDPDPESKTGLTDLPDDGDADDGIPFPDAYDVRALPDLTETEGVFHLSGPYASIIDFELPEIAPVTATHPDSFHFTRSHDGFEDVMVYFHVDQNQRYIQSLGFTNANHRVQELDSHGLNGADNAHYVIGSRRIAYGDGGVDGGEDADIVIHEYGHAIQHDIVPGWGGGEQGQMGEGFGDYWAGSYSRSLYPNHEPNFVFNWDGHNQFWFGRLLVDSTLHYPENCCGQVHASGTLWCSGLMDAWQVVGRTVMDRLVLDHHFALGTSATMADAAHQILQSDIDLYAGAHVGQLVSVFDFWGFVDADSFLPVIVHTPLLDTEDTIGPYVVTAAIASAHALDPASLQIHYGTAGAFTDSLLLAPTGNPNEYAAAIPGPLDDVDVRYYLRAADVNGAVTHPIDAPAGFHSFHVGTDTLPPVIAHTPIVDTPREAWPADVEAAVTDNVAVEPDSVRVDWTLNGVPGQTFYLARVGATSLYAGVFPSDTNQVVVGDSIAYRITARDRAATPNVAVDPSSGNHTFDLIQSLGSVLVLDDDELPVRPVSKVLGAEDVKGAPRTLESVPEPGPAGQSAAGIAQTLRILGYVATIEPASSSNPMSWSSYDLLVSSSGSNLAPVSSAAYRAALESYVTAGGKLLVEGGEVLYAAANSPGYPAFAANVLHSTDWDADDAGALTLLAPQVAHPIARTPNTLPATLPFAYTSFGNQDSYKPNAPAYIVYGVTAQAGNGGILVHDDTPSLQSAQTVVLGFDFKRLADAPARAALLENIVAYLLRLEGAPTGSIYGDVELAGRIDYSGVTVTALPGGQSAVTDATGAYALNGMVAWSYDLAVTTPFYEPAASSVEVIEGEGSRANFILYPRPEANECLAPGTPIPDSSAAGITSDITVPRVFPIREIRVSVNIPHTAIGDLIVELHHGDRIVRLHDRTGGNANDLVATYPTTRPVDGPGSLSDFLNESSAGTWTLWVRDSIFTDVGMLGEWCLMLIGPVDSNAVVAVAPVRQASRAVWLAPGHPNPVSEAGTTIGFALPRAEHVTLAVYDIGGRRVRTLVDRLVPAGEHRSSWDGRDERGARVPAGVYLYRLRAGSFTGARRLVVLR